MSEAASAPAAPIRGRGLAEASPARTRWSRPPEWLWGLSVALQVVAAAALTSYTFFFVDDFLFMAQARTQPFDLTYLREGLFEHFSPVSRLLDSLIVTAAPGSFGFAHGVELALYAMVLVAFALLVRTILGNGWGAFGLTLIFGQSIFLMRLLNWWTATANILPASIGVLVALWCYLRWRENGSRAFLIGSFAAYAVSLLDYETAILFPVYLALLSGLVLERRPGVRSWIALLVRERWAWGGYVLLDVAALINYYSFYYYPAVRPSLHAILDYLGVALFQTFVPALVGVKYPATPGAHTAVVVACGAVVVAAIAATLYLRPRAWRCLVAFIGVFLITMLPVGLTRVARFGVSIGHVVYYQQSLQFMFLVLAAFALSPSWSGRRATNRPSRLRALAFRLAPSSRRRLAVGVGAVALAAYTALYLTSLQSMSDASWQPRDDRAYVHAYLTGVAAIRRATGSDPVLVDLKVPKQVLPVKLWPYTTYGQFFALFEPHVRTGALARRLYVVGRHGRLIRVTFTPYTHGLTDRARTTAPPRSGRARAAAAGSAACVSGSSPMAWLRIRLQRPQGVGPRASGLPAALSIRYRMLASATVVVKVLRRSNGRPFGTVTRWWGAGSGVRLIPLPFSGTVAAVQLRLPAHACVSGVTFGQIRFADR